MREIIYMNITSFFIKRPRVTNLILILVIIMGVASVINTRKQDYPTVSFDIMKITTEYYGASSEDVEINVTEPIEDELMDVEDVEEIKSLSMEGLSMIFVYIDPDASDPGKIKGDIRDAVDRVTDLPDAVDKKPEVEEIRSTNMPVLEIGLYGNVPELELRQYAKALETDLKTVPGVGVIEKIGYRKREIHIEADQAKLAETYVSLGEVMNAIKDRNVRTSGGTLESYLTEKKIVTFAEYADPMEVKDVIIRSAFEGYRVRISDVAEVMEGFDKNDIIARSNGEHCIAISVRRQENADIIKISDQVKERLRSFQENLPANVTAKLMYDNSVYTTSMLSMVRSNGIMGFILVLVVMFAFLDWKSAFWTAAGIPIAMCGAFIFFEPFGITINVITLSAMILVLGMLVDDAIVISENTFRMKEDGMPAIDGTIAGVKGVFWPVVAASLTTVFAFMPMLFMKGITGKFIIGIPIVVVLMLGFSLIESTCFLPCHLAHAMPPKTPPKRTRWIPHAIAFYQRRVEWCLEHRKKVIGSFFLLFVVVMAIGGLWLKFILFPQTDSDIFNIIIEAPKGTTKAETDGMVAEVEKIIADMVPQEIMQSFVSRIGHHDADAYGGTAGQYDNWGLVTVYLKPADDREMESEPLIAGIQKRLDALDGYDRLQVEALDDGPPTGKPITVVFTSSDDGLRNKFEKETLAFLSGIDGVYGIETNNIEGKDELQLKLNYEDMARVGITALDVARTVRAAFEGEVVTSIRRQGEEIDFRVQLKDPENFQAEGVLEIFIANNMGKLVPLKHFAHFEETVGPAVIHHYDGKRSVTVTAEVDTKKTTSLEVNQKLRDKFSPEVAKHPGARLEFGGEEKKTEESMQSFYAALVVALIAIYFLLVILFDSYFQPLLIMVAIPFALVGVVITFIVHGLPLGFIAMIGILGLVGVVVNDSIVMVSCLNEVCQEKGKTMQSVIEAATKRFRPVILTSLTTVAGLLPTAYGVGGDMPVIRPMVLVMAWGLIFATLVTLIFVPALYSVQQRIK